MTNLFSDKEWKGTDRQSLKDYDQETVWRSTIIQALLVGESVQELAWHRLERYFDCLYIAGPKLWARLLPELGGNVGLWEGDIGELFRSCWNHNEKCTDGWDSGYLLRNPFLTPGAEAQTFQEILRSCLDREQHVVSDRVRHFFAGES